MGKKELACFPLQRKVEEARLFMGNLPEFAKRHWPTPKKRISFTEQRSRIMPIIAQSVLRLVCVAAFCLAATTLWVVDSAHESIVEATAASAERVAAQLENLYWRELLWRGSLRKTPILPVPEWETLRR